MRIATQSRRMIFQVLLPLMLAAATLLFFDLGVARADEQVNLNSGEQRLRIVSFNLDHDFVLAKNRELQFKNRLQHVIKVLKGIRPDVITLQEVSQSLIKGRRNSAQTIAKALGMNYVSRLSDGLVPVFAEGLAVLSRFPILHAERKKLPHSAFVIFEQRFVQKLTIAHPQIGPVIIYNTHLKHTEENKSFVIAEGKRLAQNLAIAEYISGQKSCVPTFLFGDMNANSTDPSVRIINGSSIHSAGQYTDLFAQFFSGNPPITYPSTFERLDYAYLVSGWLEDHVHIHQASMIFTESTTEGLPVSDHLGLYLELEFTKSALNSENCLKQLHQLQARSQKWIHEMKKISLPRRAAWAADLLL